MSVLNNKYLLVLAATLLLALNVFLAKEWVGYAIFFGSKRTTVGKVIKLENLGNQEPYRVLVTYSNSYLNREVGCSIILKKSIGNRIKANQTINIDFGRMDPCNIYLSEYKSPRKAILFLDGILIIMLGIGTWVLVRGVLSQRSKRI